MRFLLDTHTLIWYYQTSPKLSTTARALIDDPLNQIEISPASYWEVAIKFSTQKSLLHVPFSAFVQGAIYDNGFAILSIEPRHCERLISLPFHHKDPFDRLLIAQALAEGIPIVSADATFDAYGVTRLW